MELQSFLFHLFVLLFFSRIFCLRRLPLALDFCHWFLNFIIYFVSAWLISIEDEYGIGWFHVPKRVKTCRKVISSTDFRTTQIKLETNRKWNNRFGQYVVRFWNFLLFSLHTLLYKYSLVRFNGRFVSFFMLWLYFILFLLSLWTSNEQNWFGMRKKYITKILFLSLVNLLCMRQSAF